MKRFSFPLDRVLSFRENQRRQAALELEDKQRRQAELRNQDESVERSSVQLREERARASETTGFALRASEAYLDSLDAVRRGLREEQKANQQLADQAMAALIERDRQVNLLEKLRARRQAVHERLEDREQQIEAGEQSLNRWRRSNS